LKIAAEEEFQMIFGRRENHCSNPPTKVSVPPLCRAPEPRPEYISSNITPELIKSNESSEIK